MSRTPPANEQLPWTVIVSPDLAVSVPAVEVHLSNINRRESFRRISVTAPACRAQIVGHGFLGYMEAIDLLAGGGPLV